MIDKMKYNNSRYLPDGKYDFIYLTNTPSFYKLNLCNEISLTNKVLLVFYGYGSEAVNTMLEDKSNFRFDYVFLYDGDAYQRNQLQVFIRLLKLMRRIRCRKILYCGWLASEYNLYSFLSPKEKNVLVCESSIIDVSLSGIKGWIKQKIIRRMGAVLPSGQLHKELFTSVGFKGEINITGSVGIFNKGELKEIIRHTQLSYLYVGRLIDVKNLELLIEVFNQNGKPLTLVGQGVLEKQLKRKAEVNIVFRGFIDNEKLGEIYQEHDVFILPSYSETWGLVVEEAIYWGLPVIVSDRVGSSIDMVADLNTGCIFHSNDMNSLHGAITTIESNYDKYKIAVDAVDFDERDRRQVAAYINLLR